MKITNKTVKQTILVLSACAVVSFTDFGIRYFMVKNIDEASAKTGPVGPINMDALNQDLGNHILRTMEFVKSPLSLIQRQLLAQTLVKIANDTFETQEQKRDWIRLIGIESKFDNSAKSGVGAIGLGQIMPQYAKEFGKYCGLNGVTEKDAADLLVNATLSACVWRKMLDSVPDNSVILALSAYNSGLASSSTKNISKLGSAVPETANYIARFSYLKEVTDSKKDK
jgi:hypothetical protein